PGPSEGPASLRPRRGPPSPRPRDADPGRQEARGHRQGEGRALRPHRDPFRARRRRAARALPTELLPRRRQQDGAAAAERLPHDPGQHREEAPIAGGGSPVEAAERAASEAGTLLLSYFGALDPSWVEQKAQNDMVSRADR